MSLATKACRRRSGGSSSRRCRQNRRLFFFFLFFRSFTAPFLPHQAVTGSLDSLIHQHAVCRSKHVFVLSVCDFLSASLSVIPPIHPTHPHTHTPRTTLSSSQCTRKPSHGPPSFVRLLEQESGKARCPSSLLRSGGPLSLPPVVPEFLELLDDDSQALLHEALAVADRHQGSRDGEGGGRGRKGRGLTVLRGVEQQEKGPGGDVAEPTEAVELPESREGTLNIGTRTQHTTK